MAEREIVDISILIETCTKLLMKFQRKEQLPRKFVPEDYEELDQFEQDLSLFMAEAGAEGEAFLRFRRGSPLEIHVKNDAVNTRDVKRCLKLMVAFRNEVEER